MISAFRTVFLLLYLLLEMLHFTSAALVAEERQRYVADRFERPPHVLSGAGHGTPQPPHNLITDPQSDRSVLLIWQDPSNTTGLDHYLVYVEDEGMQDTTTGNYYLFHNLQACTNYTFGVMSVSPTGGMSDPVLGEGQTLVLNGGPPENLKVVAASSAIFVSWSPPADEPLCYVVSAPPCTLLEDMVFGLSYLITGLDPCETCEIYVTSYYDDTIWYTEYARSITDGGNPPPPESCSVQVEEDGLAVTWEKPVSECSLGEYSIRWTGTKLWGDGEKESGNGTAAGTTTRYTVVDTVPYSQYTFEISASIDGIFGSPTSCSGTSQETQPGPPVIVAVDPGQGEAVVTWETPVEENGLIVNYGIFVDEATDSNKTVSGDVHNTSLELEPCKTFGLSVKAKNGAGWGPPSEVKNVTAVDDAASPPTELVQVAMDVRSVTVQWSLPESLRGRLLGWYLNWTSVIGHYLGEQYVTNPEERMVQIGDLDPSEVYNVYVMAVNGAGKGELAMLEASTEYVPWSERAGPSNQPIVKKTD